MRHSLRRLPIFQFVLRAGYLAPLAALFAFSVTWLAPWQQPAQAGQPRDWMIAVHPEGTDLSLDVVFPGTQATLEHRIGIYNNNVNQLTFRANGLATGTFAESQADVDLRIVVLTLGASAGYRDTFRNHTFDAGESTSIMHRLDRDLSGNIDNAAWSFMEGRIILSLPFNDNLVFNSINRFRHENRPDRSYDWRTGVVHDGGYFSSENMLLYKDRHFGGIGPMVQVMNYDFGGKNFSQVNWGAVFTTRMGLRSRDDLIFVQALFNVGTEQSKSYGLHFLTIPMTLVIAYRAVLPYVRP